MAITFALVAAGIPDVTFGPLQPSPAQAGQAGGGKGGQGKSGSQRGGGPDADGAHGRSDGKGRGSGGAGQSDGQGRSAASLNRAQERYARALDAKSAKSPGSGSYGSHDRPGRPEMAHEFSAAETTSLIDRGWRGPKAFDDGFANHGQRVSTMVGIAKALGYPASVGAKQANFGTPFENGIYGLEISLAAAQAQQAAAPEDTSLAAQIEGLAANLAAAIGLAKPGAAPDDGWATVDLDINDDLVVDRRDLEAARAQTAAAGGEAQP